MGKKQINLMQISEIQKQICLYMNTNGYQLGPNHMCLINEVRVVLEINGIIVKDDRIGVSIDENSPMKIALLNNTWDASKNPLEYWYATPKITFRFDQSIGLIITGNHPIHGDYKTTIYNL